jgi:pimeloyl-ACP methyl ester carboxylesterase
LIHGNGGSIYDFSNQIPYFSQKYKVIAVDSRAQGKSTDPGDSLSFEMMTDDFNALLDSLHMPDCRVIGWSDGGINALIMAIRHPHKVKMLASTGANLTPDTTLFTPKEYNQWMHKYLISGKALQTAQVKNNRKLLALDLFQPQLELKDLATIQCPSLIIGGDHDLIMPAHTFAIAQAIPGAFLWIIPDSGHSTPKQHKEQFNQIVDAFFCGQLHNK